MTIRVIITNKLDDEDSKKLDAILAEIKSLKAENSQLKELAAKLDTGTNALKEAMEKVSKQNP